MVALEVNTERRPRRPKLSFIPADLLRINNNGIFVKGESGNNQARVYEDMCAKRARIEHPGRFIISPRVFDQMSKAQGSIFAGSRPDILILEAVGDPNDELNGFTVLRGMQECKSGVRKSDDYGLPNKAGGFYRLLQQLDDQPQAIGEALARVTGDLADKIPIDINTVIIPRVIDVTFVTNSEADEVSPTAYPRMRFHYDVVKSPLIYTGPYYSREDRKPAFVPAALSA